MTDDAMIDLTAGDAILRQRLLAYADARLSPDVAASARIRARVLATAHRRAELARADAALTVVRDIPVATTGVERRHGGRGQRAAVAVLVATLAVSAGAGSVLAARPGGALYGARLWVESVTLPSEPSQRALAELDRLEVRLAELRDALRDGDGVGAEAALAAFTDIVGSASASAVASHDDVATAALSTGVGNDIEVLQGLITTVPATAVDALSKALQRAIDRSQGAIEDIDHGNAGGGGQPGKPEKPGGPAGQPTPAPHQPASQPTPEPTAKPGNGNGGGGNGGNGNGGNGNGGGHGNGPDHPQGTDRPPKPTPDPPKH